MKSRNNKLCMCKSSSTEEPLNCKNSNVLHEETETIKRNKMNKLYVYI